MFTVTLIRGREPTTSWEHDTRRGAERRARTLAGLHGAEVQETADGFVVDASEWYGTEPNPGARRRSGRALARSVALEKYKGFEIVVYPRKKHGRYGGFILTDMPLDPLEIGYAYTTKAAVIQAGKDATDDIIAQRGSHEKKIKLVDHSYRGYKLHTGTDDAGGWFAGGDDMPYRYERGGELSNVQGYIGGGFGSRAAAKKAAEKMVDLILAGSAYDEAKGAVQPKGGKRKPAKKPAKRKAPKKRASPGKPKRKPAKKKVAKKKAAKRKPAKKKTGKRKTQADRLAAFRKMMRGT